MGVTKRSVLQGVKEDYGDALPSSKIRCTHFEACEEDVNTSENETKSGNGRGMMHGQAHLQQASSISQELRTKSNKPYCMS